MSPPQDGDALRELLSEPIDWRYKGFPPSATPVTIGTVGEMEWNLLAGDLPLPVMVLKDHVLVENIELMAQWCSKHDVQLAPHGKTSMAPQIFARQLNTGAWGITAATASHARMYRAFGIQRILLANELVEPVALQWLAAELAADPLFEFYCLVDSPDAVAAMNAALENAPTSLERPVQVLLELGVQGGRTGCRNTTETAKVAAAVAASRVLELAGVECFEGVIGSDREAGTIAAIDDHLRELREVTIELGRQGAFEGRDGIIVSAGGSGFFDRVAEVLTAPWGLNCRVDVILRSGGYATHDSSLLDRLSPLGSISASEQKLRPALEVWGVVLSRPEPELAIVGFGKRDVSYDVDLPIPQVVFDSSGLRPVADTMVVTDLNDQHAFVQVPVRDELAVGDMLACGISHPCTAFDKWRLIPLVDRDYTVVGAIHTFF